MGIGIDQSSVLIGPRFHFIGIGDDVPGERGSSLRKTHLRPVGNPAPPRPRRPESRTTWMTSWGSMLFKYLGQGLVAFQAEVLLKGNDLIRRTISEDQLLMCRVIDSPRPADILPVMSLGSGSMASRCQRAVQFSVDQHGRGMVAVADTADRK